MEVGQNLRGDIYQEKSEMFILIETCTSLNLE